MSIISVESFLEPRERKRIMSSGKTTIKGDESAEKFIHDDSPEAAVNHRVVAGVYNALFGFPYLPTACSTTESRSIIVDGFRDRIAAQSPFDLNERLNNLLDPPRNMALMMDRLITIMYGNRDHLREKNDRTNYERFMRFVARMYCGLFNSLDDDRLESATVDQLMDFMMTIIILENSPGDPYHTLSNLEPLKVRSDLEYLGVSMLIDSPEVLLSSDVVLNCMSIDDIRFNPYFALATRPDGMSVSKAVSTLPRLNDRAKGFVEWKRYRHRNLIMWSTLTQDWDHAVTQDCVECYQALDLILEDRRVSADDVAALMDCFFPVDSGSEFDEIKRAIHNRFEGTKLMDYMKDVIVHAAIGHHDIGLIKAFVWLIEFARHLPLLDSESDGSYRKIGTSRKSVMNALDLYGRGMPWSFIMETIDQFPYNSRNCLTTRFIMRSYDLANRKDIEVQYEAVLTDD